MRKSPNNIGITVLKINVMLRKEANKNLHSFLGEWRLFEAKVLFF